jgi:hypothetical protein
MPKIVATQIGCWLDPSPLDLMNDLADAVRLAESDPTIESAVVALGVAIDAAASPDPRGFARCFQTDPARTLFPSVLAQLGSARLVRMLLWLTEPEKPNRRAILDALFAQETGDASDAIRRATRFASRHALLTRITAEIRLRSLVLCARERLRDRYAQKELHQ